MISAIRSTWENFLGRTAICFVCFGWLPFYLLMQVKAQLAGI